MTRFFLILIIGIIGAIPVRAQVYAEQVLSIGRNVLAMDDYVLAIRYFNLAAGAKPYLWDPYYYRALAKLMLDDYHGAEEDASLAIDRNKFKYEAYRVRGFARLRLDKDSAAIEDFNIGLSYSPDDKYFLYYKGIAQTEINDYSAADSTFSHLLALNPRFDDGHAAAAQAHLLAADTIGALASIDRALAANANMVQPRLMRAEIAFRRSQWAQAAADLDTVINLEPRDASLHINRAYARYNADDWAGAMADYNYTLDLEPDNYPALYNRALLRFQVQDLQGARADFTEVLKRDPNDFPARYNRGLINLDLGNYKAALSDFQLISKKYPRFYPAYYAISRAYQGMGNPRQATDYFFKANDLITRYTANPKAYKLDRPTIQNGSARNASEPKSATDPDSPEEVMEHFNELVIVSQQTQKTPLYGEKLRGRVQDIDSRVEPAAPFALTIFNPANELHPGSLTFPELTDINNAAWLTKQLFLTTETDTPESADDIEELFNYTNYFDTLRHQGHPLRPIDELANAVALTALKNYPAAMLALDHAIAANPQFISALLQRAYLAPLAARAMNLDNTDKLRAETEIKEAYRQALSDYNAIIDIDARIPYAWYGKGILLYNNSDYTDAADCFSRAITLNPDLGPAYFNRALCLLRLGRKNDARADLSRAGQLGIPAAYNLLKKL